MQSHIVEQAATPSQSTENFSSTPIDQKIFQAWIDVYTEVFQPNFHIPQLGLSRFYQERTNHLSNQFNLFQASVSKLINLMHMHMKESFNSIKEKIGEASG
jgi:hypothetical protein